MTPNHEHEQQPPKEMSERTKALLNDPKKMAVIRMFQSLDWGDVYIDTDAMIRRLRGKE